MRQYATERKAAERAGNRFQRGKKLSGKHADMGNDLPQRADHVVPGSLGDLEIS